MNSQTRFPRTALAVSLIATLGVIQPSFADEATKSSATPAAEQAAAQPDLAKMRPGQKAAYLAHTGRLAMSHIETARQSLKGEDTDTAKQQLVEAQTLLTRVQDNTQDKLVPLFARIDFTEQFEVTDEVERQLDGINPHIVNGDHDKVVEIMKATGAAMAYTHAEMPVVGTIAQVDAALKAIAGNATDQAEQALTAAVDGIRMETLEVSAGEG